MMKEYCTRHLPTILLLLMVSALLPSASHAQTTYQGIVCDSSTNAAIDHASVMAYNGKSIVAYTFTDSKGRFTITIAEGKKSDRLTFTMLGYRKVDVGCGTFRNGQRIRMAEEMTEIREVTVRTRGIHQRSDTLSYTVNLFKQKQDRSIADVISHMPGVTVEANGVIKYMDKPINKFYVEGMDLMGGKYSMVSENLQAVKVKRVEILRHHQPVKMMRGKMFSEQAAVNIVLTDDAKNVWNGALDAGAGAGLQDAECEKVLRDVRAVAMLFGRRRQTLTMYKTANTGRDIQHEVRDLTNTEYSIEPEPPIISDIYHGSASLADSRYNMNSTHIAATNWLLKSGKDATTRLQAIYLYDNTTGSESQRTTHMDIDGNPVVEEEATADKYRREAKVEIQYQKNSSSTYIDNVMRGNINWNTSYAKTTLGGNAVTQRVEPRSRSIDNSFRYRHSIGREKTLNIDAALLWQFMPSTLSLLDNTAQGLDLDIKKLSLRTGFSHRIASFKVSYSASARYTRQEMERQLAGVEDREYAQRIEADIEPSITYGRGGLNISCQMPIAYLNHSWSSGRKNDITLQPRANISLKASSMTDMSASYSHSLSPYSMRYLLTMPYYTSYINMAKYNGETGFTKRDDIRMSMKYANPLIGLFANMHVTTSFMRDTPVFSGSMEGNVYTLTMADAKADNTYVLLSGSIEKAMFMGHLTVGAKCSATSMGNTLLRQDRLTDYAMRSVSGELNVSMIVSDIFSLDYRSKVLTSRNVCKTDPDLNFDRNTYFSHSLTTRLMPGQWVISLSNELYHADSKDFPRTFFSDLSVSYKTRRVEVAATLTNIFGQKEFSRNYIYTTSTCISATALRPRELLIKTYLYL